MANRPNVTLELDSNDSGRGTIFEVLADPRRRFSLRYLGAADTPVEVAELTTEIAAWEANQPVGDRSGGGENSIEVSLVHTHLPKMADAGVVEYDADRGVVSLGNRAPEAKPHLELTASD